ncbi:MAG: hypothetical protein KY475_16395 [Planctomycetes bacterium]|nr:hypothetical protein [Planctomycetota bacterium]
MPIDFDGLKTGMLLVAGAVSNGGFSWYVSTWDMWMLDKWDARDGGFQCLFTHLQDERSSTAELRNALMASLPAKDWADIEHMCPSLFVDFDQRYLCSVFRGQIAYELAVPAHWSGSYDSSFWEGNCEDFLDHFPSEDRYWVINGVDVIRLFKSSGRTSGGEEEKGQI